MKRPRECAVYEVAPFLCFSSRFHPAFGRGSLHSVGAVFLPRRGLSELCRFGAGDSPEDAADQGSRLGAAIAVVSVAMKRSEVGAARIIGRGSDERRLLSVRSSCFVCFWRWGRGAKGVFPGATATTTKAIMHV